MRNIYAILLLLYSLSTLAQNSSRNGYYHSSKGTIRAFVVFAEVTNDDADAGALGSWTAGNMPPDASSYIDYQYTNASNVNGFITKYFYEASLGNLILIGDYYPYLVQIPFSSVTGDGRGQVIDYLHNLNGSDITTAHGFSLNNDFDSWTISSEGAPKTNSSDGYIDMLIIVWRSNSKMRLKRDGGHMHNYKWPKTIKNKSGFNCDAHLCSGDPKATFRHEFAHSLLGDNNFHSGGCGAGNGTFISNFGGYSILSSSYKNLDFANGWDRYRLGWKNPSNTYYISARNTSYSEVNADLVYGQSFPGDSNEFILRDFATYGDAIRIKLPYMQTLDSNAKEQWLWIENHQLLSNKIEYHASKPKGIRINLQVGNESFTNFKSSTNYISPFNSFGNYDFEFVKDNLKASFIFPEQIEAYADDGAEPITTHKAITSSDKANPFTGNCILESVAYNHIDPNIKVNPNTGVITKTYQNIHDGEHILPKYIEFNGENIYDYYPIFGNEYDIFPIGSKLSISTNPAPVNRLTYGTPLRFGSLNAGYSTPQSYDNRNIYLNGLSIEILEQNLN
jgi:hypothetical protein